MQHPADSKVKKKCFIIVIISIVSIPKMSCFKNLIKYITL
jgi:hypothetical protein